MVAEAEEEELPLPDAILKWCDPDLLKTMRDAEAWSQALGSEPTPDAIMAAKMVKAAQKKFLDEVRWRLEIGVILLSGIQVEPELQTERTQIPGEWATLMEFDFKQRAVTCPGRKWIAVRGRIARLSQSSPTEAGQSTGRLSSSEADGNDSIADQAAENAGEAELVVPPAQGAVSGVALPDEQGPDHTGDAASQTRVRPRGRASHSELILEGLRLLYADRDIPPAPPNGWTALARRVGATLQAKYPMRHAEKKLPALDTIRTRLPRFYDVLQAEAAVRK